MIATMTRRGFGATAAIALAAPFIARAGAAEPIELRCSLDTEPSHPRNGGLRDYLAKIEAASGGQIQTKLFESGALFPDLHVIKALVQGQVEMACPGTWTMTGLVPDADLTQLPAFYGRPIDVVHKVTDGPAGKFVNGKLTEKLHVEVLGGWFDLGFNNWYSTKKPLQLGGRSGRHEAAQPWRRAELLAHPLHGRHPERDGVAGRSAGDVAGHVRRADHHQQQCLQLQAVRFRPAPLAAGPSGRWGNMCRCSTRPSGASSVPSCRTMMQAMDREPAQLSRELGEGAGRRPRGPDQAGRHLRGRSRGGARRHAGEDADAAGRRGGRCAYLARPGEAGHGGCRRLIRPASHGLPGPFRRYLGPGSNA